MSDADHFVVKDSGERIEFPSGMKRDTSDQKVDYALVLSGPLVRRLAKHLTLGAEKYGKDNWLHGSGVLELERFRESAFRHFIQWWYGDEDEDHFAAVVFNMNGAEYVKEQMEERSC